MTVLITITWLIVAVAVLGLGFYLTHKTFEEWAVEKGFIVEVGDDCEDFKHD